MTETETETAEHLVTTAAAKRAAEQMFLRAVLDAVAGGMSYRTVAEHTGMSKSRIHQIIRTEKENTTR